MSSFSSGLFSFWVSHQNHIWIPPNVLHALHISTFFTWLYRLHLGKSTSYKAPHYVVFSDLILLHPSLVQINSYIYFYLPNITDSMYIQ
jgi:hypothetical protein